MDPRPQHPSRSIPRETICPRQTRARSPTTTPRSEPPPMTLRGDPYRGGRTSSMWFLTGAPTTPARPHGNSPWPAPEPSPARVTIGYGRSRLGPRGRRRLLRRIAGTCRPTPRPGIIAPAGSDPWRLMQSGFGQGFICALCDARRGQDPTGPTGRPARPNGRSVRTGSHMPIASIGIHSRRSGLTLRLSFGHAPLLALVYSWRASIRSACRGSVRAVGRWPCRIGRFSGSLRHVRVG